MALESAKRDENFVTTILGVDMSTGLLPTKIYVDETTHRLLVNAVVSGTSDFNLTKVGGATFALGQQLAASSLPIVLTAAQMTTLTPPAAITGFLTESDFDTKIGSLTETAPATDTASSGLNGRLQRLAQRLTSIIALLPTSLGQKARASSLAVTLSSEDITAITPPAAITGYATASNQTDKSQFTKITDGTDTALVTASGEQNVLETNSAAIKTAVETIDNIVSGAGINQTQVGGTNIDTNSGVKSAGTQRVVLATDQPQLTNALKVDGSAVTQPVSGAFYQATQPVSIAATVTTSEAAPTTIYNGNKNVTTAGTRVTLASSQAVKSITIKAKIANTGTIYVGDTSVSSSNGFALAAGETLSLDLANLNTVNLDASVSGEGVTYIGVN